MIGVLVKLNIKEGSEKDFEEKNEKGEKDDGGDQRRNRNRAVEAEEERI